MIRIVRTRTLRENDSTVVELYERAEELAVELTNLHSQLEEEKQAACDFGESLLRTQDSEETLRKELAAARDDLAHTKGELTALTTKHLLDAEDRVVLRMLLKTARRHNDRADRVHVLFRHGRLHGVYATRDAAEIAAEAEGATRDGWAPLTTSFTAPAPDTEIPWRIEALRLKGVE
ncbi:MULTISPECIES: hypothetical protein [Streptomyces]|uniref:hypothetical protein n=1 Tax=Streptomyces TaxID=1883 RepID=UPI0004BD7913|nr:MULTISPECIES: hypothetical protein [Streptomyces]KUJ69724.1 hypothetical protein ACZ90_09220 [Streptomyces albus subsp. albus]